MLNSLLRSGTWLPFEEEEAKKEKKKKSSEGIIPSNMLSGGANVLRLCGPVAGRHSPAATESSLRLDLDLPCPSGLGSKVFGGCAINNMRVGRERLSLHLFSSLLEDNTVSVGPQMSSALGWQHSALPALLGSPVLAVLLLGAWIALEIQPE